ncbi:MAG: hypothetical protein LBF55_05240 [Prevotellaceae bacterium]|jgi:O-glycosyl hydrolase|nr:hypothetical protein [Prevotellaceae bacterium]
MKHKLLLTATVYHLLFTACSGNNTDNENVAPDGDVQVYLTVRNTATRLAQQQGVNFSDAAGSLTLTLNTADVKQEIEGFGAALTGSSAYLMKNMTAAAREKLLKDLFTGEGIDMKYMRLCKGNSYRVNEEYYLLGHFSKFVQAGAHRVGHALAGSRPSNVDFSTFLNPDGSRVVVAVNQSGAALALAVSDGSRRFAYTLPDQSSVSLVYR